MGSLSTQRASLADIRNDIAHPEFVSSERGEALLRTMFFGEKSLFNRCQSLYNVAKREKLLTD